LKFPALPRKSIIPISQPSTARGDKKSLLIFLGQAIYPGNDLRVPGVPGHGLKDRRSATL